MILTLIPAAIAGFIFGFLLQKGRVARFDTIVGQLLLKNFTMAKVMFTAIVVGSIGIYALLDYGYITTLPITPIHMTRIIVGASIFGVGMAILGYCPGTSIAAWATGAQDALFGILGMLTGAFLFVNFYSSITQCIPFNSSNLPLTLPHSFGISPWVIIGILILALFAIIYADKKLKILK